jgi:alanyl-tRNA synthetase
MNQFKDHFLGRVKLEFTRATTCQKCLRTGDIDNVGRTAYHHTFFEMLGNFSFGDYFKREAIHWAWEFLTDKKWLGIDPAKLSATVYKEDSEAAKIWLDEIKLPPNRLQYLDEDENFWPASAPSQGPDGVCGPCSEIYHETPVGPVEIWNLVFTQFNRVGEPPNNLRPLPSKNIDTGMGLERCAAVLQGVDTNYHIDILRPLVETAGDVLGVSYLPKDDDPKNADNARRLRRIADHIRACAFAVHENVYPGNKEEKYVIRRLLRRAVLDGRQIRDGRQQTADGSTPFLHLLVPKVAELMRVPYPELSETVERVQKVIQTEEEHFLSTLDSGIERIEKIFEAAGSRLPTAEDADLSAGQTAVRRPPSAVCISGADIFDMYQTFGFPPELFETLAAERGYRFDWAGFKREMEHHGEVSGSAEKNLLFKNDPLESVKKQYKRTEFCGYNNDVVAIDEAEVLAIVVDGKLVDSVSEGQTAQLIINETVFYGEKGGQVGDIGVFISEEYDYDEDDECIGEHETQKFVVEKTQIDGDLIVHIGHIELGTISVGDVVEARRDCPHHQAVSRAHTATHLLHYVLRNELGGHAEQQGSKVDADVLRFDFTHHQAIDKDTLRKIENDVNKLVLQYIPGDVQEMPIEEARKTGAMMLFGEKYPETVRVVRFGDSVELCGGTHLHNTCEIGFFKIISEESVSAGTRRITAYTGRKAAEYAIDNAYILAACAQTLKVSPEHIVTKIEDLQAQVKKLQKELKTADGRRQSAVHPDELIKSAQQINGIQFIAAELKDIDVTAARELLDHIRSKEAGVAVLLALAADGKVTLLGGLSKDLVGRYSAVDLIRRVTPVIGGKGGGGRPDFAQSGGTDASKIAEALNEAKGYF